MLLVLWVHLLAAIMWIGGMLFLSIVLVPVFKRHEFTGERRLLFQSLALRFRMVVWLSIMVLLGTGALLLITKVGPLLEPEIWPTALKVKLALVAILLGLTVAHDFWVGPLVAKLKGEPQERLTSSQQILIRLSPWIARLGLVLAVIILFLAVLLARL